MALFSIAAQELRYMLFSLQGIATFLVLFGIAFLLTANSAEFESAASGGSVLANSPYTITRYLVIFSILSTFIAPAFIANAVLKDRDCHFDGILYALPITQTQYLIGRFSGAYLALTLAFTGAPIGMLLGTFWPWAEPALIGPTHISHYLIVLASLTLPTLLAVSAIIYATAVMSGKYIMTYITSLGLLVLYTTASETGVLPAYFDPFMFREFEDQTQYWTASERNTQLLHANTTLILNRLIWAGVALISLLVACHSFSFRTPANKKQRRSTTALTKTPETAFFGGYSAKPIDWQVQTPIHQFISRSAFEIKSVMSSWPFVLLMLLSVFMLVTSLSSREVLYEVNAYPLTRIMISNMGALLFAMLCVLVFYSADIIWRDRDNKVHEILDALPVPNWVFISAKILSLLIILSMILILGIVISVGIQLANNFYYFEPALYFERGFFYLVMPYICMAILACFLQILAKNRYVGMLLFGLFIGLMVMSNDLFDLRHPLFSYGIPAMHAPLSDMNGSGRFITAGYWQRGYWLSMAGLLLLLTYKLWPRGVMQPLTLRARALFSENTSGFKLLTAGLLLGWLGTGSVIFYNTNVLNDYLPQQAIYDLKVEYENQYRQEQNLPTPRITEVDIDVDIYPQKRRIEVTSTHVLENKTGQTIDKVHVNFPFGSELLTVQLDGAEVAIKNDKLQHYIFNFSQPMQPGQRRNLHYSLVIQQQGFKHDRADHAFVRNGSFIHNNRLAPYIGFNPEYMIEDKHVRDAYDLPPLNPTPKLEDTGQHGNNVLRHDSDFIRFRTTVSTSINQTVVAPGSLISERTIGDRRYFTYAAKQPIHNFYSYLSADYEVKKAHWNEVSIEVFYHPTHDYNLDRMIASVQDSLTYFSQAFSPYQYDYVRIMEFPDYRKMAQAFSGTIPYSEGIGFVADVQDDDIDIPYYVTAHEMAHQWWGHQVAAANTQGNDFIHESLAQYGAMMVMEKQFGPAKVRQFLRYELDRYLTGRADATEGELPLYKVEKQQHIYYRKGALVMYALRDYLGEDAVNAVLKKLIAMRQYSSEPYATSLDFMDLLKNQADPTFHSLIDDLLKKITLYDLNVSRCETTQLDNGRYRTSVTVNATKHYADALGNETDSPLNLAIDIGLFSRSPEQSEFDEGDILWLNKSDVKSGENTFIFETKQAPLVAGIDPFNKLVDRKPEDNLTDSCQVPQPLNSPTPQI